MTCKIYAIGEERVYIQEDMIVVTKDGVTGDIFNLSPYVYGDRIPELSEINTDRKSVEYRISSEIPYTWETEPLRSFDGMKNYGLKYDIEYDPNEGECVVTFEEKDQVEIFSPETDVLNLVCTIALGGTYINTVEEIPEFLL